MSEQMRPKVPIMEFPLDPRTAITTLVAAFFPTAKIYLFGSLAQGTARSSSDIDVAIDIGRRLTLYEWDFLKEMAATMPLPRAVDIVDFHAAPASLQEKIISQGIVWKE